MDSNTFFIVFIVGCIIVYVVLEKVIGITANKADDALSNAWARFKNSQNPPKERSLAEIYGQQVQSSPNANATPQTNKAPVAPAAPAAPVSAQPTKNPRVAATATAAKFCRACGAPLNEGANFCKKCGSKVK